MQRFPILIVGGTGAFGARIAELLARDAAIEVILGGRTRGALDAQARVLSGASGRSTGIAVLDATQVCGDDIAKTGAALVINASGPFQTSDYRLAQAAIAAPCHYIDLADAPEFVTRFPSLDSAARAADVLAVSGASSVPGLSSAVVSQHRAAFSRLERLDIAISPGNAFDPGVATVASVLGGVGQPLRMLDGGAWRTVYGWQGLERVDFGAAGTRWAGYVDVPDLVLFPAHDAGLPTGGPGLGTVRFQAGLEVAAFHLGLWAASWIVRSGLVRSLAPLAPALLRIKRSFAGLGSDRGGMVVSMSGTGVDGERKTLRWLLVARSGHGPYVPALASVALARRLASGLETRRGAHACFGLVGLDAMLAEARHLDIACTLEEKPLLRGAEGAGKT
ncbi:saccharopine dehydrogenase NADP-binding domain-containing protein [uncultured Hyphomicrobium sp.]|uniref:saccharopine dehydrogenase family protein n=1 Tax=uncultured Hyphomicrobium sp. TaxID=194373 RepID=UPI0025FDDC53|nr:saccharopine dehydrogenase NADP-binding domain-containing protein [uncultured Hyphomicrobium sp.]